MIQIYFVPYFAVVILLLISLVLMFESNPSRVMEGHYAIKSVWDGRESKQKYATVDIKGKILLIKNPCFFIWIFFRFSQNEL